METSLILGLVGGLIVAGFAAFVALRSTEDELEYEEGVDGPVVKAHRAKPGFFAKLGFGRKKKSDSVAGKRSEKAAGWRREIEEACEATGLVKTEAVNWIAPLIIEGHKRGHDDHAIASKISGWGNALEEEEKANLGVRADAKLGREYFDCLTRKGRRRPLAAAFFVVQRATHAHSQSERLKAFEADETIEAVEVVATEGALTCLAAQDIDGQIFDLKKAPSLPLRRCDAETCRCVYQAVSD